MSTFNAYRGSGGLKVLTTEIRVIPEALSGAEQPRPLTVFGQPTGSRREHQLNGYKKPSIALASNCVYVVVSMLKCASRMFLPRSHAAACVEVWIHCLWDEVV